METLLKIIIIIVGIVLGVLSVYGSAYISAYALYIIEKKIETLYFSQVIFMFVWIIIMMIATSLILIGLAFLSIIII